MNWIDLISKMEPLKTYYVDNLMQLADSGSKETLKAIRDAGEHIEKPLGKFRLSHKGEQLKKNIKDEPKTASRTIGQANGRKF